MNDEPQQVSYPDALGNGRTFLAWIRTSLGLIAGGVALDQFVDAEKGAIAVGVIAFAVITLGAVVAVIGVIEWKRTNLAMNSGRPIPKSRDMPLLGIAVLIVTVAIAVALLMENTGS